MAERTARTKTLHLALCPRETGVSARATCCVSTSLAPRRVRPRHPAGATGLRRALEGRYELEVIDIYQLPALAKNDQIIATPTLVKVLPAPLRRFIGDLSKVESVLFGMDVQRAGLMPDDTQGAARPDRRSWRASLEEAQQRWRPSAPARSSRWWSRGPTARASSRWSGPSTRTACSWRPSARAR